MAKLWFGSSIRTQDARKDWRDYVEWGYEGTYRDKNNPEDVWCPIPNNNDANIHGLTPQDPRTSQHDDPYARIISGFLSDFNSGQQNFSGVVTSPQTQTDGAAKPSVVTPTGGVVVQGKSYPFTPTGFAMCEKVIGAEGISYSRAGLGGSIKCDAMNVPYLNFQNQKLIEVNGLNDMPDGRIHHINLNGNNLNLDNPSDDSTCIPNFLDSSMSQLYSFVCRDNHFIAPYATQQLNGSFPELPSHLNRFEMAGHAVALTVPGGSLNNVFKKRQSKS